MFDGRKGVRICAESQEAVSWTMSMNFVCIAPTHSVKVIDARAGREVDNETRQLLLVYLMIDDACELD